MSTSYLLDSSVLIFSLHHNTKSCKNCLKQHLSIAIQYGLTLAARDHHFTWIADLSLEQW